MKMSSKKILGWGVCLSVGAGLLGATPALARESSKGFPVTTGINFVNQNQALTMNPAALADAQMTSLEGVYLWDPSVIHASVATGVGSAGLAAAYRGDGDSSLYEGGIGINGGATRLGVTLRGQNGSGLDGDVGLIVDLSKVRIGAVAKGLSGGIDLLKAGIGGSFGTTVLEFDVYKPAPLDGKIYYFDVALGVDAKPFEVGVGYTFAYGSGASSNKFAEGSFHATLGYQLAQNFVLEGFYHPLTYNWPGTEWAAGARYQF